MFVAASEVYPPGRGRHAGSGRFRPEPMVNDTGPDEPATCEAIAPSAGRGREAALVLLLVVLSAGLALYRTGDRDLFTAHEGRAARVARHMLESDTWPSGKPSPWLVPQFSCDALPDLAYQKPPLYYWAVAGASAVCGKVTNLTVRLPSAVSLVVLVVVILVFGVGRVGELGGALGRSIREFRQEVRRTDEEEAEEEPSETDEPEGS